MLLFVVLAINVALLHWKNSLKKFNFYDRTGLTNLNTPISGISAMLIGPMGQKVESK